MTRTVQRKSSSCRRSFRNLSTTQSVCTKFLRQTHRRRLISRSPRFFMLSEDLTISSSSTMGAMADREQGRARVPAPGQRKLPFGFFYACERRLIETCIHFSQKNRSSRAELGLVPDSTISVQRMLRRRHYSRLLLCWSSCKTHFCSNNRAAGGNG